jgi:copper chaperone CopZ
VSLAVAFAAAPAIAGSRYALRVDGLACPFCAYGIEKQLSHVDGVKSITTDIGKGEVVIEMVDGKALDPAAAERAVKKAGFKLRGLEPAKSR